MEDALVAFTIRTSREVRDRIDQRAKHHHRQRNGEVNHLLAQALDRADEDDRQVMRQTINSSQTE